LCVTEGICVYADRLVDLIDYQCANNLCITQSTKLIEGILEVQDAQDEHMFCTFPPDGDDASFEEGGYALIISVQLTNRVVNDKRNEYNETHAVMNLVLFNDAVEYVLRIARGSTSLSGHMLVVGLVNSGKWFLVRLAAAPSGCNVFRSS
jgi:dynein heavy chain